jgi:hypothetical protein
MVMFMKLIVLCSLLLTSVMTLAWEYGEYTAVPAGCLQKDRFAYGCRQKGNSEHYVTIDLELPRNDHRTVTCKIINSAGAIIAKGSNRFETAGTVLVRTLPQKGETSARCSVGPKWVDKRSWYEKIFD